MRAVKPACPATYLNKKSNKWKLIVKVTQLSQAQVEVNKVKSEIQASPE